MAKAGERLLFFGLCLAIYGGTFWLTGREPVVEAQGNCVKCASQKACGPGDTSNQYCCCQVTCAQGGYNCTCTNFCTWCGSCALRSCNYQTQMCSAGVPDISPSNRPAGARFFQYTEFVRSMVEKKSPFAHTVLTNLTMAKPGHPTGWIGRAPDATDLREFSGIAGENAGDFEYTGTIDVEEGHITLELVAQPDEKRKRVRRTVVDAWEDGPVDVTETYE